jgi:hypothetical protein
VQRQGFEAGGSGIAWDSHDRNLLAENRDVFYVPAAAYER